MKKNDFRRTGVVYYSPDMVRYIDEITKDDNTGNKIKEVIRYVISIVSGSDASCILMSNDEANELRKITAKYNVIR